MYFYIDYNRETLSRYDASNFMENHDGFYDSFTSFFLEKLRSLPLAGIYQVEVDSRPDIYSRDVYGTTNYWQILLEYNNIILISDIVVGMRLRYPDISSIESLFFRLKSLQKSSNIQ